MKTYRNGTYSSTILDLGTRWRGSANFTPTSYLFTPEKRAPCNHAIGDWLGARLGMDAVE
jgi:hypothetical protein